MRWRCWRRVRAGRWWSFRRPTGRWLRGWCDGLVQAGSGGGEPGGIRYEGRVRRAQAEELRAGSVTQLREAVDIAQSSQWQGKAAIAFADAAQSLIPEVLVIAAGLENDAVALERYAGQVEHIQADAQALRARQASLWRDVRRWRDQAAGLPDDFLSLVEPANAVFQRRVRLEHLIEAAEASLRQVEAGWDDLTLRRRMTDAACVAALTSAGSRGNLAAVTAGAMSGLTGGAVVGAHRGVLGLRPGGVVRAAS